MMRGEGGRFSRDTIPQEPPPLPLERGEHFLNPPIELPVLISMGFLAKKR